MLNTYFTDEVPYERQWAQFFVVPFTFHKNWMQQMSIFFNWKRTLFKISSELACLTHARTAIQQAEN